MDTFLATATESVGIPKSWDSVRKGDRGKGNDFHLLWSCFLSVATSHQALALPAAATGKGPASGMPLCCASSQWAELEVAFPVPQNRAGESPSSAYVWWGDQCPGVACASGSQLCCCTYKSSIYEPVGRWQTALSRAAGKWVKLYFRTEASGVERVQGKML